MLVSDLSLAAKYDRDELVAFVVDAVTGNRSTGPRSSSGRSTRTTGRPRPERDRATDARGLVAKGRDFGENWGNLECFAHVGGRFAMIDRT